MTGALRRSAAIGLPPIALIAAVFLIAFSAAGCSRRSPTPVVAEILLLEDDAAFEQDEHRRSSAIPAISGMQLRAGDTYRVPDRQRATISLVPGIAAVAHGSAELQCEEITIEKNGNETGSGAMQGRRATVQVRGGAVTFALPWKDISGRSEVEVSLPLARVTSGFGSLFHVVARDNSLRVTCLRIALQLHTSGEDLELTPGQSCEILAGGGSPLVEPAAESAAAQDAVQTALADEELISQAMLAKRNAVPAWRRHR